MQHVDARACLPKTSNPDVAAMKSAQDAPPATFQMHGQETKTVYPLL
jgi:hypothetical protein